MMWRLSGVAVVIVWMLSVGGAPTLSSATPLVASASEESDPSFTMFSFTQVQPSSSYEYIAPPSISREMYISIYEHQGTTAAPEAGAIYDHLVSEGFDPAIHAAQAMHETGLGTAGIGNPAYKNMHGVQCHSGDGRVADSSVPWGNGCAGVYASYLAAVQTWARLIKREYVSVGLTTPDKAVWKYAPVGKDGNNPPLYIADMHKWVDRWRSGQL